MSFEEKLKASSIWLAWLLQMFQMNIGNEHKRMGETWEVQLKYVESDNYFWLAMFTNPTKWIIQ